MADSSDGNAARGSDLVAVLLLGAMAGAAATWLLSPANREKLTATPLGDFVPKDWLEKAAKTLQEGRDRIVDAVDRK